jgi:hypothetical protein
MVIGSHWVRALVSEHNLKREGIEWTFFVVHSVIRLALEGGAEVAFDPSVALLASGRKVS